jgi:hypothetical protein
MLLRLRTVMTLLSGVMLAACAADLPLAASPMRLLVKLVQPTSDPTAIAALVSRGAGVPARYIAASSAQWHAVGLECETARDCESALARLRADRGVFEAVERDERKRIVTP